ncbi:hypothetical protein CIW52_28320 [Mycolicibacterium sp. P9-64]|nr:hypothetical protein CIW52_28320 [Mycolicibacterium sp. P9-64]
MIEGSAIVVVGVGGGFDSVTVSPASVVSPVLIADDVTGPGGAGSAGSAELVSLKPTDTTPIARTAPAPAVANINFVLAVSTPDHSNSISSRK